MKNNTHLLMSSISIIMGICCTSLAQAQTIPIADEGDFGGAHNNFPASNATDKNTAFASRWAANFEDAGGDANLFIDFGSVERVSEIGVAWGRGNQRSYDFEVRARAGTSGSWTKIRNRDGSSGNTNDIEVYDVDDIDARQVRVKVFSASDNSAWVNITEFEAYGANSSSNPSTGQSANPTGATMNFRKRNQQFSIDGAGGAQDGIQVYLWNTSLTNVNQQWTEYDVGDGFFAYQKRDTNLCIDGGNDGRNGQAVILFACDFDNQNQHWQKVSQADGHTRFQKRNASGFSIDGKGGAVRRQLVHLWANNNNNVNQHWDLTDVNNGNSSSSSSSSSSGSTTSSSSTSSSSSSGSTTSSSSTSSSSSGGTFQPPAITGTTFTTTVDSLEDVMDSVSGGDEVIVTGSGEISLKNFDFSSPVTIRAASIGGTTLENATIDNSNNIVLQGFVFGPNEESTLLKIVNSTNISILRNLFDHEDITENQTSIVMTQASRFISIGYNEFRDKNISDVGGSKITGSFIKTQFDDPLMTRDLHVFRNHFNNITPYLDGDTPAGDSDREAIALGIADSQDVDTNNLIEYNLFENCDGENEIITVKTSSNVFRYNTFENSMGSLSLRLGSDNEVYGNYFFGEGSGNQVTDNNYQTGGIRVYGSGHSIYDNYMEGLTGISWRRPILIDSGDTSDSTGNDSHEVTTNTEVRDNTIINSVGGGIHIGSDNYSRQPTNIDISGNTVVSDEGILYNNHAVQSSNTWSGNAAFAEGSAIANGGGFLNSSAINVLSNEPTINKPTPLSSNDVGRFAP